MSQFRYDDIARWAEDAETGSTMIDSIGQRRRCRHCRRILPDQQGAGRPREFCSGACRQREWVFRQRADELKLSDDELIVMRDQLDALYDELYVLACAIEDARRDGAMSSEATKTQVADALRWIVEAASPLIDPDRLNPIRP